MTLFVEVLANRLSFNRDFEIVSYDPFTHTFEQESILDPYDQVAGTVELTADYLVLWQEFPIGVASHGYQINIYDRSQKIWRELQICEHCTSETLYGSVLVKNGLMYVQTRTWDEEGDYVNTITVIDLATFEVIEQVPLETIATQVLINDSFLDTYNYPEVSRYRIPDFKFLYKKTLNAGAPLGVHSYAGQRVPMLISGVQPAMYNKLAILDVSYLTPIMEIGRSEIERARKNFAKKLDFEYLGTADMISIDAMSPFVLWKYYDPTYDGYPKKYGFIYSDLSGNYHGHIELPVEPFYVFTF